MQQKTTPCPFKLVATLRPPDVALGAEPCHLATIPRPASCLHCPVLGVMPPLGSRHRDELGDMVRPSMVSCFPHPRSRVWIELMDFYFRDRVTT